MSGVVLSDTVLDGLLARPDHAQIPCLQFLKLSPVHKPCNCGGRKLPVEARVDGEQARICVLQLPKERLTLYLDGAGKVWFGVYNGGYFTIGSPGTYTDGQWHMAAATMGTGGMRLYVDGDLVGTNANTAGETTTGWFRAGCGNLGGWGGSWTGANNPTTSTSPAQDRPFTGSLDEVSIWQSVLTPAQIRSLYIAK